MPRKFSTLQSKLTSLSPGRRAKVDARAEQLKKEYATAKIISSPDSVEVQVDFGNGRIEKTVYPKKDFTPWVLAELEKSFSARFFDIEEEDFLNSVLK
jgi:hypothetical protein